MKKFAILLVMLLSLSCDNNRNVITVGNSTWMKKNLAVDHFRNGDSIMKIQSLAQWHDACAKGIPAYCVVNDSMNSDGYLYNFGVVKDKRNIAPNGYRITRSEDWEYAKSIDSMKLDMVIDLYNENKLNVGKYWCLDWEYNDDSVTYAKESCFWTIRDTLVEYVRFYDTNTLYHSRNKVADEGIGINAYEKFINKNYLKHDTLFTGFYIRCVKE